MISHPGKLSQTLSFEPSNSKRMPLNEGPIFETLSRAQKNIWAKISCEIQWNPNKYENVPAISKRIWSHCVWALSNSIKHSFTTRMSRRLVEPHEYGWVKRLLWLSIKISLWKDFFRAFFGFITNVKAGKKAVGISAQWKICH